MTDETKDPGQAIVKAPPPMTEQEVQLAVLRSDFANLSAEQRDYVRLYICKEKGYDPLTNALMFIPDGRGGLKLYAGAAAAKTEKAKHKIKVVPVYMGPMCALIWDENGQLTIGATVQDKVFVTIWKASSPELGDTYDGSALALDPAFVFLENAFKKLITQGTNRVIFRHVGNPFMDASEAEDVGRPFTPPSSPPPAAAEPQKRVPAPRQKAEIKAQPVEVQVVGGLPAELGQQIIEAQAVRLDEGVAQQPQSPPVAPRVIPKAVVQNAPQPAQAASGATGAPRPVPIATAQPSALPGPRAVPSAPRPAQAAPVKIK